jgi:hypothetical protein
MANGPTRPKRPPVVSIVVIIFLIQIASFAVQWWQQLGGMGAADLESLGSALAAKWLQGDRWIDVLLSFGLVALVVASVFTTIGLARLRPWAWLWAMTIQGVRLFIGLVAYFRGDPHLLSLVIPVVAVLLLDQEPVRRAFGQDGGTHA